METILEFIQQLNDAWFYAALFVSAYLENIIPPIPGDTVTVFGAYLVGTGRLSFVLTYVTTTAGSILGFMTYYVLGRFLDRKFFESGRFKFSTSENFRKIEQWYKRYGYWIIAANRFLSGLRSVISLFSGLAELNAFRVFLLAFFSCAIWNGLLILLGIIVGENWEIILQYLQKYNVFVLTGTVTIAVLYIILKLYQKRRKKDGADNL